MNGVRCFRRKDAGTERRGVWIMTRPPTCRGVFFHGDRKETQAPAYSVDDLADAGGFCEEITPEQVLVELESWPEARQEAVRIFERHNSTMTIERANDA